MGAGAPDVLAGMICSFYHLSNTQRAWYSGAMRDAETEGLTFLWVWYKILTIMVYGWKQPMPMWMPLMGGGDGVCGYGWLITPQTTMPMCLAMINFNENARA